MTDTGRFATASRTRANHVVGYARACLEQGKGYQATAAICNISEADLREMLPGYRPRQSDLPVLEVDAFVRAMRLFNQLSDADLRRVLAVAAKMVGERDGNDTLRMTLQSAIPGLLWEPLRFVSPATPVRHASGRWTGGAVMAWAAGWLEVSLSELEGDGRYRSIARPRQIVMFLMRRYCPHLSFPAIGRLLGGRDHTTILHGVKHIDTIRRADPEFDSMMTNILRDADAAFPMAVVA